MANSVYKYPLKSSRDTILALPIGAELLHVNVQNGGLFLWAKVDADESETEDRSIEVVGTGHSFPYGETSFINTILIKNGSVVLHAFERL